ncbi:MAG: repeat protein [Thermoleophilia bacterium]|nr:repeat protein [Thermoleophilia bacterium]
MPNRSPQRRHRLVQAAVVLLCLVWIAAIAAAAVALRNQPAASFLDTELEGVQEAEEAKAPTVTTEPEPAVEEEVQAEGPCWPIYGRTVNRASDAADLGHGIPKTKVWEVRIGIMEFPPSFCDGVLYVNAQRGTTSALDAETKKLIWRRQTAQVYDSTPAVSGQRIIVGSYQPGDIQALDRATGKTLWKVQTGGSVESSPIVVDGIVYATSKDRRVYAIDVATGKIRWAFRTGGEVKDSPTVVGGIVYIGNYAAEVFALNAKTGKVVWRNAYGGVLGDRIYSSVPVVGRTAYFTTVRGHIYAVDSKTGATRWHKQIPGYLYGTPAISGGKLFVGNYPGTFHAYDARTGRDLWSHNIGGSISGSATVIGKVVYISSLHGKHTIGYSTSNGRQVWRIEQGRYVSGIGTDRALYLSLNDRLSKWTTSKSEAEFGAPLVHKPTPAQR